VGAGSLWCLSPQGSSVITIVVRARRLGARGRGRAQILCLLRGHRIKQGRRSRIVLRDRQGRPLSPVSVPVASKWIVHRWAIERILPQQVADDAPAATSGVKDLDRC
jgi:hypothetical protein